VSEAIGWLANWLFTDLDIRSRDIDSVCWVSEDRTGRRRDRISVDLEIRDFITMGVKNLQNSDLFFARNLIDETILPMEQLPDVFSAMLRTFEAKPGLVDQCLREITQFVGNILGGRLVVELDVVVDVGQVGESFW